jgi:colanic acid/amylovoran biosynthesis protein
MEKTICTRFHSLVMSLAFKHELMVVSYSDKLNNLLDDLGYDFDVVNIDEKIGKLVINDSDFKRIDDKTLNHFKREAIRHFESLDNSLKLKRKSNKLKIKKNTLRSKIYSKLKGE